MVTEDQAQAEEIAHIKARLIAEIETFDPATAMAGIKDWNEKRLEAFLDAVIEPELLEVNLAGGVTDFAYAVTKSNGAYRLIWLPWLDLFSLAVESKFGPVDINVHGEAIACFCSV